MNFDVESRRRSLAALRDALSRELGASAAEFTLQVEALTEVIPDLDTRRRAALSVLAKKGVTQPQLCVELEHVLVILAEQQRAFLEKLKARRDEHSSLAAEVEQQFSQATEAAGREIERLQAALDAARSAQSTARNEREQRLQTLATASERLTENELAFGDAYQRVHREYQALCEQLARISTEKFQ